MKLDKRALDCITGKFDKITTIDTYEISDFFADGFYITLKMKDGSSFHVKAIFTERSFPSVVSLLIEENKENLENFILVSPYISPRTAELCEANNIGYFDYSGNCRFANHSIYILEKGNANSCPKEQKAITIFNRSSIVSSLILRELFSDTKKKWKIKHLSEKVHCSIGQVSKLVNYLIDNAWMKKEKDGYVLINTDSLLRTWAQEYGKKSLTTYSCYSMDGLPTVEEKMKLLNQHGVSSYLTGIAGGVRYTPVVRYNKLQLYVASHEINNAIHLLDLKEVNSGANVILLPIENESYIKDSRIINGMPVVSPIQIYLDCMQISSRGEEMAMAIKGKVIDRC